MRWLFRSVLFLLLFPLAYWVAFPQIIYCQTIDYADDFERLETSLYVSRNMPIRQRLFLQQKLRQAKKRIETLWGNTRQGRATVIFCQSSGMYERYCRQGEGAGCSLGTPWGDSWIIINPYGLNSNVLAHEMCHDELFARLGWFTTQRQIPQWFNEGLALMVDYRFSANNTSSGKTELSIIGDWARRYGDFWDEWEYMTHGQQQVLELKELESSQDFFSGDERRLMLAYVTAGMEVSRWLSNVGKPGILALIKSIKAGNNFDEAYRRQEQYTKKGKRIPSSLAPSSSN